MFENDPDAKNWSTEKQQQFADEFFVEIQPHGEFGLPTLHHYMFPDLKTRDMGSLKVRDPVSWSDAHDV